MPAVLPGRASLLCRICCAAMFVIAGSSLADTPDPSSHTSSNTSIPYKREKQSSDSLAYQSLAGLVLAALAAYGIVLGLKRYGSKFNESQRKSRRLRTIEAIRLGRRSVLYVVEYDGQELLLVESEQGVQMLSNRPAAGADASNQGGGNG